MLLNPVMMKTVIGNTDLSLEAKSGESLLIKDILVYNSTGNYITCKTDKSTVGYFRVGGNLGSHLPLPIGNYSHSHGLKVAAADGSLSEDHAVTDAFGVSNAHLAVFSDRAAATTESNVVQFDGIPNVGYRSLLRYLSDMAVFKGFPVAEGETFEITGAAQSGAVQIVIYEKYTAGDINKTDPNGSASKEYMFVNYGRPAANITTSTDTAYDTQQTPSEFPSFPYEDTVPAKTVITLHGILASDVVDDRGSDDTMNTKYLKLIKEREVLFDEDRNGLLLYGIIGTTDADQQIARGVSVLGNYSTVDIKPPFMLPQPMEFVEGEELNVKLTTTAGASQSASDLVAADVEVGLILTVKRAE